MDFVRQGFGGLRAKDPTGKIAARRAPKAIARSRVGTSAGPACPAKIFQSRSPLRNLVRSRQAAALGGCAVKGRTTTGRFQDPATAHGVSRSKLELSMLSRFTRPAPVHILAFDVVVWVWVLATGRRVLLLRPPAPVFEVCGVPQSAGPFAEHSEAKPQRKYDYNYS